jgi:hypothetical protein
VSRGVRSALAALALAACDWGTTGPGTLDARVTGDVPLGGVVLDVTWRGAEAFNGRGSTQVYWAPIDGSPDRYRVILIAPPGEELLFSVEIEDVHAEPPTVTVAEATDAGSEPVPASGVRVRIGA